MAENFNTVATEVKRWREFTVNGVTYDLSHLDVHWVEYTDNRDQDNIHVYKFIVTYSMHCFAKDQDELTEEERQALMYFAKNPKNEKRPFNLERYYLSKQLPEIIKSLGEASSYVFHAGYGNYATAKIIDADGNEFEYFVAFSVFREAKKLRLHVQSAYPLDTAKGKRKKVGFFVIAHNLLKNKKLPEP
jgi:hypothetical protein